MLFWEKISRKKKHSQIWRLHLAQELDDAHARPSFVFADWLAELHSLYPAKGKINPHENFPKQYKDILKEKYLKSLPLLQFCFPIQF